LKDYELEDPAQVPEGAQRMATMWSMIPDDPRWLARLPSPRLRRPLAVPEKPA
jgi:hypothetical protein